MVNEEERRMDGNLQVAEHGGGGGVFYYLDFNDLPKGCIAAIISFQSPPDACRLAMAADSDLVWKCFLLSDYQAMIDRLMDRDRAVLNSLSQKQLYYHLTDEPILIDGILRQFFQPLSPSPIEGKTTP
ncbi:hypothetical protein Ancab_029179 [Ancistrocladus abbreviatus]